MSCDCASLFCNWSLGLVVGEDVAAGVGAAVAEGLAEAELLGVGLGFGLGDAIAEIAGGGLSANAAAGARINPRLPARANATQPTVRRLASPAAMDGRELTPLCSSLQVLRPGRMPAARVDPKTPASAGPFMPGLYSLTCAARLPSWAGLLGLTLPYFHIFVMTCPLPPFWVVRPGTCGGQRCAILPRNQLELSRGK